MTRSSSNFGSTPNVDTLLQRFEPTMIQFSWFTARIAAIRSRASACHSSSWPFRRHRLVQQLEDDVWLALIAGCQRGPECERLTTITPGVQIVFVSSDMKPCPGKWCSPAPASARQPRVHATARSIHDRPSSEKCSRSVSLAMSGESTGTRMWSMPQPLMRVTSVSVKNVAISAGAGGKGARAVLEVRSREVPFILEHGQIVGRLVYEKMLAKPEKLYGQGIGSNYQAQSLKLSKHFKA